MAFFRKRDDQQQPPAELPPYEPPPSRALNLDPTPVEAPLPTFSVADRLASVIEAEGADDTFFNMRRHGGDSGVSLPSQSAMEGEHAVPNAEELTELKQKIHRRFVKESEDDIAAVSRLSREALTEQIRAQTNQVIQEEGVTLPQTLRRQLLDAVVSEIVGFGPLEALLKDENVTEVMVNSAHQIYVERKGKLTRAVETFEDDAHVLRIIERIVAPLGRRIDESSPMVDARLPDGSRVNAIIPPLAIKGPSLTIRKFSKDPYKSDDLVRFGTVTPQMVEFLRACVYGRLNIIVSGGTGSGKTTTLNVLSSFIPDDERIVTIEDAAELQLQQDHVVTLESRPSNLEGKGEISIRQLVKNSLRMRPDRIIVGECRAGEALDMLQAMNTGHDGSLSTAHANTPRDAVARLETMVLMAGTALPVKAIREQIASAVQLIVQQGRLRDGSRKITHITEVQGMEGEVVVLQDIFRFEQRGVDANGKIIGEMRPTGLRPKFMTTLTAQGINFPKDLFL
ncbi:type II secretion system protein E [Capsulimonas corticalis]|uniref:Type II secretion system protein E n=2 Tax=Capsulimonas corticalis TaxID=2219043 RepID=A0A402CQ53_9BACT|nr:CpaF family protein [Capsulimonas corticalis]BDI32818.1 type II secretion system protein E [Capsulimonas corticalis]